MEWFEYGYIIVASIISFIIGAYFGWKVDAKAEQILIHERMQKQYEREEAKRKKEREIQQMKSEDILKRSQGIHTEYDSQGKKP